MLRRVHLHQMYWFCRTCWQKMLLLEYYPPGFEASTGANFSQVMFDWQDGHPTNPWWQAIAPETAQALISQELQLLSA